MKNEPIKIIWKYKNNNKRIQYNIYIYIGSVPKDVNKALETIRNYTLYEAFAKLSKQDYNILEKYYGEYWYRSFYNTYHINSVILNIRENKIQNKELLEKFGKEWFSNHIDNGVILEKKILYSYESIIKTEVDRKTQKKERQIGKEDETDLDYKTTIKKELENMYFNTLERSKKLENKKTRKLSRTKAKKVLVGGGSGDIEDDIENEKVDEDADLDENLFEGPEQDEYLGDDEEMDLVEIEELYKTTDVITDKNIDKTTELIKKAIDDNKIFDKKNNILEPFDDSVDKSIHDINLRDVYIKHYVESQFIFKDDTIKSMKNKIICSLKNNSKFEKNAYLIPSRIYLWSEYFKNNKVDKIMIGQKWIRRNELLNIDIEPNNNMRIYEELGGNLRILRDNMKRFSNRIRWEDDENKLIYDYDNFYTNNEFYMIDIYNEFGKNYGKDTDVLKQDSELYKNLLDIYVKIYFNRIKQEDFRYLLDYLNGDTKYESEKNTAIFNTIYNDLVMENEIVDIVERVKKETGDKYRKIFKENYVTQSVIHVNLRLKKVMNPNNPYGIKLDLFRIFNEFTPNSKYPFIQYQTSDGGIVFKYKENDINDYVKIKENNEILLKWFENAPYGISFKVKITEKNTEKFMAINLNDQGRIEYKTQWKEDDAAMLSDIESTYSYVKDLIKILNEEDNRFEAEIPIDDEFRYAFINTIQKFELPNNFSIGHNELSDFSRYFYPYIALQIEPRKRIAKDNQMGKESRLEEKSKFGTYLRFKRVSGYENSARIEQRLIYFMRNYEFSDGQLISEISKQFNITEERSIEELDRVRQRYPNLKKSRKILKKLENLPKYKPPGIEIGIQGKEKENYKIRVSGARDEDQLNRILDFMNILIYLYTETYLFKKPERQELKEKLKRLNNIAKRRGKVDDVVNYKKEAIRVKQITAMDKLRLAFKPTEDQNQWSRCCQNSGKDKRRRPNSYVSRDLSELLKKGYTYNKKTNEWERKIITNNKKTGKKEEIILKTLKVPEFDDDGNKTGNDIHYVCSPEENGDHMYVGFLSRCINPHGHCMPCCFKKDLESTNNQKKMDFYQQCIGENPNKNKQKASFQDQQEQIDKLYILQDTNKIQVGRIAFLPKYLDFFMNIVLEKDKTRIIKQHYLTLAKDGYFFKFGINQDVEPFMNALSMLLDISVLEIKQRLVEVINSDTSDQIFTSLNNGDIKLQFETRENYIDYIKYNTLDYEYVNNLLSIPGVVTKEGLNIIVFYKQTIIIKKTLEKEKTKDDFYIICQNPEDKFSITDSKRETIFMLKEYKNYYPIIQIIKTDQYTRNFSSQKKFKLSDDDNNIVKHVTDFYQQNCSNVFIEDMIYKNLQLSAIETYYKLEELKLKEYLPKYQIIDVHNKCKFFVTQNNYLLPVRISGTLYNIQILKSVYDTYYNNFTNTLVFMRDLAKKSDGAIKIKPTGVYYEINKKTEYKVIAIVTQTGDAIPIIPEFIEKDILNKEKLNIINKSLFDELDKEIAKGKSNYIIDKRILEVNHDKYQTEAYELFRLELSNYLNNNKEIKEKVFDIVSNKEKKIDNKAKLNKIKLLLYRLIDNDLYKKYKNTDFDMKDIELSEDYEFEKDTKDTKDKELVGGSKKIVHIISKEPDMVKYKLKNERELCEVNIGKDKCNANPHCYYYKNNCYPALAKKMIIIFINKVAQELVDYDLKAFEILRIGDYFVSDIADINTYKEYPGQKIIKSNSSTIKKALQELFGKDRILRIGRRKSLKNIEIDYMQINEENPPKYTGKYIVQEIIPNNITLFRAFVNSYYWIKNNFYDDNTRNLGFYNPIQTDFANYFKSLVIDWLQEPNNKEEIENKLAQYMEIKNRTKDYVNDFIIKLGNDMNILTNCIVELYILNKIEKIPIVIYDDDDVLIYVFNDGLVYNYYKNKNISKDLEKMLELKDKYIVLKFTFISNRSIPDEIESIYIQ